MKMFTSTREREDPMDVASVCSQQTPLKVKKVEVRKISIRFRVSWSTKLEMRARASNIEILVKRETTSKLTMRSSSSR
jgi:hypothetical protein